MSAQTVTGSDWRHPDWITESMKRYQALIETGFDDWEIAKMNDRQRRHTTERPDADELRLYAENTAELYPRHQEIIVHILKRQSQNRYKSIHGFRLWRNWFYAAAHRYAAELNAPVAWDEDVFKAAREYTADIEQDIANGEYDYLKQ